MRLDSVISHSNLMARCVDVCQFEIVFFKERERENRHQGPTRKFDQIQRDVTELTNSAVACKIQPIPGVLLFFSLKEVGKN